MAKAQFNFTFIHFLKDILLRLHHGELTETVQQDMKKHFQQVSAKDILLSIYELKSGDFGITTEDVTRFFAIYNQLYGHSITDCHVPDSDHPGHPIQIFKDENREFQSILAQINNLFRLLQEDPTQENILARLREKIIHLGMFYRHYNRKEKLIFPILERYGYYTPTRIMWADDDRIRTLYKGTKRMVNKLPEIVYEYVEKSYSLFEKSFTQMIFQEESFILPIVQSIFTEDDWLAVANESAAFGYAIELETEWMPQQDIDKETDEEVGAVKHIAFGGGFLTIKEANNILNHLPMELTFIDKNGIFKYFNEKVESAEMVFVRTPISIGRNVANCHPPKSLKKVMRLIQDLKAKRRSSESMWFKKQGQYIHITYKGVFDEDGEYLGILEYVQDIQPFLNLPRAVKKELSELDESI